MHGAGGGRNQHVGCRGALSFSDVVMWSCPASLNACLSCRDCSAGKRGWRGLGRLVAPLPLPPKAPAFPRHHALGPSPSSQPAPAPCLHVGRGFRLRAWPILLCLLAMAGACHLPAAGRLYSYHSHGLRVCVTVLMVFLSFLCLCSCCVRSKRNSPLPFFVVSHPNQLMVIAV